MRVTVDWKVLRHASEEWDFTRCLYAYLDPDTKSVVYLGKADGTTIRERFYAQDKLDLFEFLRQENRIERRLFSLEVFSWTLAGD